LQVRSIAVAVADKTALVVWQPESASRLSHIWMISLILQNSQHAAIVLACVAPSIAGKACTSSSNPSVGTNALFALFVTSFPD